MYADSGENAVWHVEGGLGTRRKVVKFQLRPDRLAKQTMVNLSTRRARCGIESRAQSPSSRADASPNWSSVTSMRSISDRNRLDILRFSSPAST
jgi:hypothetical protein